MQPKAQQHIYICKQWNSVSNGGWANDARIYAYISINVNTFLIIISVLCHVLYVQIFTYIITLYMHFKCALTYKFICVCQKHIIKHCLNPNLGSHKTGSKMQISQWPTVTMKPNETVSQHGKSIFSVKRVGIFKVIKRRQLLSKNLVTKNHLRSKTQILRCYLPTYFTALRYNTNVKNITHAAEQSCLFNTR